MSCKSRKMNLAKIIIPLIILLVIMLIPGIKLLEQFY
jgi:hypothetical protein